MVDRSLPEVVEDEDQYPPASILIVDDRPANLMAVEALLTPLAQRIVTAGSGDEALRAAAAEQFAVILMDVHMPVVDGFETVARLRAINPTYATPIVFMSAVYDDAAHVQHAYSLGAVDYLAKPTDPELLRAKVASFVSLFRRGQELKRRGELLREQAAVAARAQAAQRLRDTYFAIVGHDLRGPLNVIGVLAQKLQRTGDEQGRTIGGRIGGAVTRAEAIVRDVLDFTRGELAGGIPVTCGPAHMGEIVQSLVLDIGVLHPQRQIRVESSGDLDGEWDRARLEQALGNLITNAVTHGTGAVSVIVRGGGEAVTVTVHNRGEAIPREWLPTIFEPFRRSTATDGLGLGLYIAHEIVAAHGGRIEVRSLEGEGTTFVSVWPRSAKPVEQGI